MPPNGVANGNHATRRPDLGLVVIRRRRRLRAGHHKRPWQYETLASIRPVQASAWHTTGAGLRSRESLPAAPEVLQIVENGNDAVFSLTLTSVLNAAVFVADYRKVNALFERALILLNKMPRIWEMYLKFLLLQPLVTLTRRTFDRALRALPITQHNRIWAIYRPFANSAGGDTAVKIWRRYMQVHPEDAEDFIELLTQVGLYTEAVQKYIDILNNPRFNSKQSKGHYELWSEVVDLLVEHAAEVETGHETGIDVERIIRSGIDRFADQRGKLWCGLATYYARRGSFERARDIFEEGITTVMTVRDFTLIFDTYVEFEESIIGALMEMASTRAEEGTYTDAIAAIQPKKAVGPFHQLWANYAKFYEKAGDIQNARIIMEKAVKVPFKSVTELADMWVEWAEMELRNDNFDEAVKIMAKAVQAPKRSTVDYYDETLSPQQRVHKNWKLWSFYVDLVESVSSLEETKKIYERIFELRIATPQTVVNYANLMEEHGYYEECFKIFERGLDHFSYPVAFELWNLYLTKAVDRKIGIERLRDLFEQAVEEVPEKFAKVLYLMYGNLEEERGLARHAMRIYERATRAVSDEDRADMFNLYITKSASNFGLPSTRPIYERAIAALPDEEARDMCLKFADMEKRLGEIDRARAIYGHASQFCDPRTNPAFWTKWEQFEVQHGNEDTYKEMLRIKRSVQAQYNTDVNFIASQAIARSQQTRAAETNGNAEVGDAMEQLERLSRAPAGFVASSTGIAGTLPKEQPVVASNPDAIDIDGMDDD
ncbi:hypothetical protein NPX13_g9560 [Xylaria arbuscula]|uniref:Pre-mRNA-splicing factor SYF1 n=1 Tax=Xylaria arbuscula TaxID=114810 RepID=A0A9W8THK7_9PEZI|nr:hypothetical protein NPX13_g9560 [Xylaria arbuscula]